MRIDYLLDTNIVSERSKPEPDEKCVRWLEAHRGQCTLSTITLAELRYGIERRVEGKEKARLERFYDFLAEDYRAVALDFDQPSAAEWGMYAAELEAEYGAKWWQEFDFRDTQIAAIARAHQLRIVTRNDKHFPFCATENPFT